MSLDVFDSGSDVIVNQIVSPLSSVNIDQTKYYIFPQRKYEDDGTYSLTVTLNAASEIEASLLELVTENPEQSYKYYLDEALRKNQQLSALCSLPYWVKAIINDDYHARINLEINLEDYMLTSDGTFITLLTVRNLISEAISYNIDRLDLTKCTLNITLFTYKLSNSTFNSSSLPLTILDNRLSYKVREINLGKVVTALELEVSKSNIL